MSVEIKRKDPKAVKKLLATWSKASRLEVAVGFPVGTTGARMHPRADMPNYQLAAILQFGSITRGIPARDFMGLGATMTIKSIGPLVANAIPAINRNPANIRTVFKQVAVVAEGDYKAAMTNLKTPANAPGTVKQKGSSNPLIDEGDLQGSVTAVVRKSTT